MYFKFEIYDLYRHFFLFRDLPIFSEIIFLSLSLGLTVWVKSEVLSKGFVLFRPELFSRVIHNEHGPCLGRGDFLVFLCRCIKLQVFRH
jgi:hypothetical protein